MGDRRLQETERSNKAKEAIAEKKSQLDAIKAQGWKLKTGDDGFIYAISADGTQTRKTEVKSGELSDSEKIRLQLDSSLQQIDARGDIQKDINNADNATRAEIAALSRETQSELIRLRSELQGQNKWSPPVQAFDKDGKPLPFMISANGVSGESKKIPLDDGTVTRTTPPGSGGSSGGTQSETQKSAGITNKAQQVATSNPEWAKYIKFSGTGSSRRFTGITTSGLVFGPKQDVYNQIYQAVYGEPFTATSVGGRTSDRSQATPETKVNPTTPPPIEQRKKGMKFKWPNGNEGEWDGTKWVPLVVKTR